MIISALILSPDKFRTTEKVTITLERDASAEFYIMQNEHNNAEHGTSYEVNLATRAFLKMVFRSMAGLCNDILSTSMKSMQNVTWQDLSTDSAADG